MKFQLWGVPWYFYAQESGVRKVRMSTIRVALTMRHMLERLPTLPPLDGL